MDPNKQIYENALKNLSGSHFSYTTKQVMGEEENQVAGIGKTLTGDFGNMLLSHVALQSLGKLSKLGNKLKSLGFEAQDSKDLALAIKNGDARGLTSVVRRIGGQKVRAGIEKLTGRKLTRNELPDEIQDAVNDRVGQVQEQVQTNRRPLRQRPREEDGDPAEAGQFDSEESSYVHTSDDSDFREPDPNDDNYYNRTTTDEGESDPEIQESSTNPQASESYDTAPEDTPELPEIDAPSVGSSSTTAIADTTAAVGDDVAGDLAASAAASSALDETGIGVFATAGLGLASLLAGLFIKSKKPKVIAPAQTFSNLNFAVQA